MQKLCVFFVLAILANQALSKNLRQKRESSDSDYDDDLEDRYGWNRPAQRPFPGPNQLPGHGQSPWQNQFPGQNQFPDQNQFPGQNQFPWDNTFPDQGQFPGQGQQRPTTTTTQAPSRSTTLAASVQRCIDACPVTSEYNPVCGSNTQTYNNPGRLICAQECGVRVSQVRSSPCPVVTAAPAN